MPLDEIEVTRQLTSIETKLDDLIHELRGNGQPGWITKFNDRVSALEGWRNALAGGLILLSLLIGWGLVKGIK